MERPTVVIELADDPRLARDISAGGVFVRGCALGINSDCALIVRGPVEEIELVARVVYVDPATGAGLELVGFTPALRDHLTRLMTDWVGRAAGDEDGGDAVDARAEMVALGAVDAGADMRAGDAAADAQVDANADVDPLRGVHAIDADADRVARGGVEAGDRDAGDGGDLDVAAGDAMARADDVDASAADASAGDEPLDLGFEPAELGGDASGDDAGDEAGDEAGDDASADESDDGDAGKRRRALNLHERLRGLTLAQQVKVAQSGDPQERILLERFYNKNVWEPLLRNPRLTPPEVARIARMGTLPRVLLEVIVGNGGWLQVPEIRRALLANPRLGTDQIMRVLRMLPKHELKLASTQTAYPHAVRDVAKRLIREQGGG